MPEAHTLLLFAGASLALLIVPGPAVLYIVTRSLSDGRRAGLVAGLGVQAGGLVHVAAATAGVSALIASSAAAFDVVKYAGAAYLIVLGVRKLREGAPTATGQPPPRRSRLFWQGMLVNVLNPKTAVFFLAFLPQFVDPARGAVTPQVALLGLCFVALALVNDSLYAVLAGTARHWLGEGRGVGRWLARLSGATYIGLGAVAALSGGRARG